MQNSAELLFALIASSISGEPVKISDGVDYDFSWILSAAKFHDILQIVAHAIIKNNLSDYFPGGEAALKKEIFTASYRDSKNRHTFEYASEIFNDAGIEFVPLKGAIMKNMYPESWLRSSCDIDILVRKGDFKKSVSALNNADFKTKGKLNYHDISLIYDDTNVELHFSIKENIKGLDIWLEKVWDNVVKADGTMLLETNDYFTFHHIAHMMHHFVTGGCGIRPFIDLWILKRNDFYDEDAVAELCRNSGLYEFYSAVCETVGVWFEGKASSRRTDDIREYIFYGGVYGNYPNNEAVNTVNSGGKVRNIIRSAFPRYENMCVFYPVLKNVPIFLPFCYLHRVYIKLIGRDSRRIRKKLKYIKEQDDEFIKSIKRLFNELNLKK